MLESTSQSLDSADPFFDAKLPGCFALTDLAFDERFGGCFEKVSAQTGT